MYVLEDEHGNYAHGNDDFRSLMIFEDEIDANLWARKNGHYSYECVMVCFTVKNDNRDN